MHLRPLWLALALAACDSVDDPKPTLVVSTSLGSLGAGFTAAKIDITADNKSVFSRTYQASELQGAASLALIKEGSSGANPKPGSLAPGLVSVSGGNLRITITATGNGKGVVRTAKASIPSADVKLLEMLLYAECADVSCTFGTTCDKGGNCISDEIAADSLPRAESNVP